MDTKMYLHFLYTNNRPNLIYNTTFLKQMQYCYLCRRYANTKCEIKVSMKMRLKKIGSTPKHLFATKMST